MERKEPCQGSSTSPASICAQGLLGCGAPVSQVIGIGGCSREGGHRQTLQKPNYTFGGSQISQHHSPGPFAPSRGDIPKGHALGWWVLRAWATAGHRICCQCRTDTSVHRYHLCIQKGHFLSLPYLSPGKFSLKSLVWLWAPHPKDVQVTPRTQAGIPVQSSPSPLTVALLPGPSFTPWLNVRMKIKCKYYCWQRLSAPPL